MVTRLWVDKYRPLSIDELDFNTELSFLLQGLAQQVDIPHLLFYGPSGAGKKTRVLALLSKVFGGGVHKTKCEVRNFKAGTVNVEINLLQSNYHIDMTPSDVAYRDKVVIQQIIKEIGSSKNPDPRFPFKVVILNQADSLSAEAQAALRRTLEKYTPTTRLILICNSLCKVISPLRSRCLGIRVPSPSNDQICQVLAKISSEEGLQISNELAQRISLESNRNLRRAIMTLQAIHIEHSKIPPNPQVPVPEWEKYLGEVVQNVLRDQTPQTLKLVRGKLFEVLASCIPPTTIFIFLANELCKKCPSPLKPQVVSQASTYELQAKNGSKPIVHLEAFLAKFMTLYRDYVNNSMRL